MNTYAAYDDLPDDEKERLDDVRVVHCMETAFLEAFPDPTEKQLAAWKHMPVKTHRSSGTTVRAATHWS